MGRKTTRSVIGSRRLASRFELALARDALVIFAGTLDPVVLLVVLERQNLHHAVNAVRAGAANCAGCKLNFLTDVKSVAHNSLAKRENRLAVAETVTRTNEGST